MGQIVGVHSYFNLCAFFNSLIYLVPKSCAELRNFGITTSGLYDIDPDGNGMGDRPITVHCDLDSSEVVTEVLHDAEDMIDVKPCEGENCFLHKINYGNAALRQITTLISLSEECYQSIEVHNN